MPQTVRVDRMETNLAPQYERVTARFPSVSPPRMVRGHRLRYALAKDPEGGAPIDIVIELRQGYVDQDDMGDLLQKWTHKNVKEGEYSHTLPTTVVKKITDYGNLWLSMIANQRPRGK